MPTRGTLNVVYGTPPAYEAPGQSFAMPGKWWNPQVPPVPSTQPTSTSGVPQNSNAGTNSVQSALSYGTAVASGPVYQNPVFIAIVAGLIAVAMFAHSSLREIKL